MEEERPIIPYCTKGIKGFNKGKHDSMIVIFRPNK